MEESLAYAKKYLEDILSFYGLNLEVYATTHDEQVIELNVPSTTMNGFLIGNNGDTMRSLQYVVSMSLRSNGYAIDRVSVDIADYKKQRATRLEERAQPWIEEVKSSGEEKHLEPMNSADRRTIHKMAEDSGISTRSDGEGPERHIVLSVAAKD